MNNKDIGGWLRRKGNRIHTWPRRWFVLHENTLMMYSKEGDSKCLDNIHLDKQIVTEPPVDPTDPKPLYFDIVNENETISLCAETIEEKQTWLRAIKRVLYADKGGALFSQSLEEIVFWEKASGRRVPYIVDECIQYLYKYGLEVEGIFRLAGRAVTIKEVISRFERGEKIDFEKEEMDIHVVAAILKAFLRDLPDSIIPCTHYQKFMNIAMRFIDSKDNEEAKDKCATELSHAMDLIPDDNYIILKYICNFLNKVALHGDQNKMNMMNLGTIFGTNIIRHVDKENSQLILCTANLGQNLVYMLLKYLPKVFVREFREEDTDSNVATADLLHLTDAVTKPSDDGRVSISDDLKGLDLSNPPPSLNKPIKMVEDHYSLSKDNHDALGKEGDSPLRPKRRTVHLSLKRQGYKPDISVAPPHLDSPNPPIPPRRNKLSRKRPVSEKHRPKGVILSDNGGDSPLQSPVVGDFYTPPETPTPSVASDPKGSCSSSIGSSESLDDVLSASSQDSTSHFPYKAEEALPTYDELVAENKKMKDTIALLKERYKKDVSALRSQHMNLKEKYELRMKTMESSFLNHKQELELKLDEDRQTINDAVEATMELKKELMRYQLKYGELPT